MSHGAGEPPVHCGPTARLASFGPANSSSLLAWTLLSNRTPGNVSGAGLAADSTLAEAVQFGGATPSGLTNETEVYDETTDQWTVLSDGTGSSPAPSPRTGLSLAGDPSTGVAVLFGGETNETSGLSANDTWVFDFANGSWTNVSSSSGPAPREDAAFAISPTLGVGLLFGGWNPDYQGTGEVTFSDTWELNLTTYHWTRVSVAAGSGPPALRGAMMDWDVAAGTFDTFGGCYPCTSTLWQFDPGAGEWAEEPSPSGTIPAPRMQGVWSYDPFLGADVLFGGTNGVSDFADTSLFFPPDNDWSTQSASGVPARFAASADWLDVAGNETLLMTGGNAGGTPFNGSWRLASTATLSVEVVNASDGSPIASAAVAAEPRASQTTNVEGYVNLTAFPSEEVALGVTAAGYAGNSSAFWLPPGTTTTVVVGLVGVAPATVDALVSNSTGTPLMGALVNLSLGGHLLAPGQRTNPTGWANFSGIPATEGEATAWAPGYHTGGRVALFASGEIVVVQLTLLALPLLEVHVTGLLPNGTVVPLANSSISLDGRFLGLTSGNGDLTTSTTAVGKQVLATSAPYFAPNTTTVELPVSGPVPAAVELTSDPPAILDLTVLNSETLLPVAVALINFTDTSPLPVLPPSFAEATIGGLLLGPILAGNYSLTAWSAGYEENSTVPTQWMRPAQIDPLTVLLTPAPKGVLDALVLDNATHDPIAGATVELSGVDILTLTSDAQGWANFSGLVAYSYEIVASATGYDSNETNIALGVGQILPRFPINLTRATSGSASGGQNNVALLPPNALTIWPLLLLPLAALALALVYLTMLRAPVAAPGKPSGPPDPTAPAEERKGFWRRLRRNPPPEGGPEPTGTGSART